MRIFLTMTIFSFSYFRNCISTRKKLHIKYVFFGGGAPHCRQSQIMNEDSAIRTEFAVFLQRQNQQMPGL